MGMSASQVRLLTLTARMSDLELEAQQTSNAKIRLSQKTEDITAAYVAALAAGTNVDGATATYNAQITVIQSQDKLFDLSLNQINTEHSSMQTEYDSVKKVIDKNVERSFKIFG